MSRICIYYRDWLEQWMNRKKGCVKESTSANDSVAVVNHIAPCLGHYFIEEITEEVLQETVLYWMYQGRLDGQGGLSQKTVKDLVVIVKSSLRAARKYYHLPDAPMELYYPSSGQRSIAVLTPQQQEHLVQAVLHSRSGCTAGILVSLYTGLRIGEICALQWGQIDLEHAVLSVKKTMQRIFYKEWDGHGHSHLAVTPPKTGNALRDMPLSSFLLSLLRPLALRNADAYLLTGAPTPMEPRTYRSYFTRFLRANGLPPIRFHSLRHTFATRCIEYGADYKTVSSFLGHASVNLTLNLYVHPQMEAKRRCVECLPVYAAYSTDSHHMKNSSIL